MAPEKKVSDVSLNLAALVTYIGASAHRELFAAVAREELSFAQLQLLDYLRRRPTYKPTLAEAAKLMGVAKSSASVSVEQLARRGLITREPDERDQRLKRILVTERGAQVINRLHAARLDHVHAFASRLTDDEHQALDAALAQLAQRDEIAACRPAQVAA